MQKAQGEILLFIDDDVSIEDPQFLDFHLSNYVDSNIHGVVGQVLDRSKSERNSRHKWSNHTEYGWLFFPLNFNKKAFLKSGASCNMSVRRLSAIEVGGMNERYEKGAHREESDFTYRLCKKYGPMIFDPNASLIHLQTPSGGIRNWNDQKFNVKAQQHFSGAIYFNLQSVSWKYQPIHWIVTMRYLFWRKELVSNPRLLALSLLRFLIGFYQAIVFKIKGPKYIYS
jgi:GT2 family glycosyltransferase